MRATGATADAWLASSFLFRDRGAVLEILDLFATLEFPSITGRLKLRAGTAALEEITTAVVWR